MGLFDGIMGGLVSAGVTAMAGQFIQQHGGVAAIVSQFEQHGLGEVAHSWIGNGANQPVTAEQVHQVLGGTAIETLAAKFGMPSDQLSAKIAEILPEIIDKMTPNGTIPPQTESGEAAA